MYVYELSGLTLALTPSEITQLSTEQDCSLTLAICERLTVSVRRARSPREMTRIKEQTGLVLVILSQSLVDSLVTGGEVTVGLSSSVIRQAITFVCR